MHGAVKFIGALIVIIIHKNKRHLGTIVIFYENSREKMPGVNTEF